MNIKYDKGDGSPVITIMDDPGCLQQTVQQGVKGNVLVTCIKRAPIAAPEAIPAMWNGFQVIVGAIDWNIGAGIAMYSPRFTAGQIAVYEMTTGAEAPNCSLSIAEYGGAVPERLMVISDKPCDFDFNNRANASGAGTTATAYFSVGASSPYGYPTLKPNTKYFVNIRNATVDDPSGDTCPIGSDCKFVMSLRHQ